MKNLIEKIASYQKAVQGLIDKTQEYEDLIKKEVPFELFGKFGIGVFGYGQHEGWHLKIGHKCVPNSPSKLGKGFYWGGDFNAWTNYVTGKELIEWSTGLPERFEKALQYVETLTTEANAIA